jgi:hypothetical protein
MLNDVDDTNVSNQGLPRIFGSKVFKEVRFLIARGSTFSGQRSRGAD